VETFTGLGMVVPDSLYWLVQQCYCTVNSSQKGWSF